MLLYFLFPFLSKLPVLPRHAVRWLKLWLFLDKSVHCNMNFWSYFHIYLWVVLVQVTSPEKRHKYLLSHMTRDEGDGKLPNPYNACMFSHIVQEGTGFSKDTSFLLCLIMESCSVQRPMGNMSDGSMQPQNLCRNLSQSLWEALQYLKILLRNKFTTWIPK